MKPIIGGFSAVCAVFEEAAGCLHRKHIYERDLSFGVIEIRTPTSCRHFKLASYSMRKLHLLSTSKRHVHRVGAGLGA